MLYNAWIWYNLFIYFTIDRHLGMVQFEEIMNKAPMNMFASCRLDGLNKKFLFLTVLEVQKSKIKVSADLVRTLFLVCRQPASFFIFTWQTDRGEREKEWQRQRQRHKDRETNRKKEQYLVSLLIYILISSTEFGGTQMFRP